VIDALVGYSLYVKVAIEPDSVSLHRAYLPHDDGLGARVVLEVVVVQALPVTISNVHPLIQTSPIDNPAGLVGNPTIFNFI
jgi:hypothetical protein